MNKFVSIFSLKKLKAIEWRLLLFLLLFIDVKLVIKVAALVILYALNPDFRFGFSMKNSRLPLFYLIIIAIAMLNYLLYRDFTANYTASLFAGIFFWVLCILAIHQLKSIVDKTATNVLHNTLLIFFIINVCFSLFNILAILSEIGLQNPFLYQGIYQKYFVNTGDYVKGVSFDTSTANALINAFGIIYFLTQKKYLLVVVCMLILLLTASNFTNLILLIVFAGLFLFKSNKDQKAIILICVMMLIIFLGRLSPQNNSYIDETFNRLVLHKEENVLNNLKPVRITDRPDSSLNPEEKKDKIALLYLDSIDRVELAKKMVLERKGIDTTSYVDRPEIEMPSIHSAPFQHRNDTSDFQRQLIAFVYNRSKDPFALVKKYNPKHPGKLVAFYQLGQFFKEHPGKMILGDGTGKFSSKLAFKTTGLKIAGSYPQKFIYINNDFFANHFAVYASFFTRPADAHSIMNNPASVYGQLLSEYGIAGLAAFFFFYIFFFMKDVKRMSYSIPLLLILLSAFFVEYWFEQLSIIILFELMTFIDIKQHAKTEEHE